MEDDITLSSLQAPLEKILDQYPDPPGQMCLPDQLRGLAAETGLPFVIIARAYKVVRDLRSRRKA